MGVTALVLGIIGICLAWIPIIGFLGFILGALAIIFGIIAVVRSHKGTATNMVVSYIGLVTGVIAFIVSIVVFAVFANQVDKHFDDVNRGPGADRSSSPSGTNQDGSGGDQGGSGAGEVVYEVTGSGGANSITFGRGGQTSQNTNAELPWSKTAEAAEGMDFYSLSAQNGQGGGDITCKITVDGEVLAENTSNGQYAVVSCNGNAGF
nr:MmpS family transport accessory protein [Actinopolyspora biskrensis]